MKNVSLLLLGLLVLVMACGKQSAPEPKYAPDSKEYSFFQKIAAKAPVLNPDEANVLVTSKEFTVYTNDVMPIIYRQWARFEAQIDQIPPEQISSFVSYAASQEGERQLIVLAAQKAGITVADSALEAEMQRIYASSGGEERFAQMLAQQGITMDFVRADVTKSLYARQYLDQYVYKDTDPTDEDLQELYSKDKLATVRHILLSTRGKSDEEKEQARNKIDSLLTRARNGEDFSELAKQYSEDPGSKANGGLYENFGRGKMVKEFEDAAFDLPIGTISDVVETEYGFHIIKVESRTKETKPFEEVKEQLRQTAVANKRRDAYLESIAKLKQEYDYKEVFQG